MWQRRAFPGWNYCTWTKTIPLKTSRVLAFLVVCLPTHSYDGIRWKLLLLLLISFHPSPFDPALSFVGHTSSPLFSAIIAWERSPLWYRLHAKSLSGSGVSKSAVCAVCGENKRAHTPVEDKQAFQIWHIYHPGTGYEQFCHLNGGGGGCIVEQEVLKDMCCTWWTV